MQNNSIYPIYTLMIWPLTNIQFHLGELDFASDFVYPILFKGCTR